ncbi:hypothetical protein [Spiroplasma monobiae]|uniref:Uncharacterized protein n=1 Tax=Spiroplasma monobiae MQ-1 TaxID=1336748 RepID=A0A2K9LUS1_SPISQ|nr:hypothetical protein [Spiroplasma monobiae]AUM62803.1 hypothetical protein SMONO_v1c05540 [Spiroplasma monobiae MQ-1]
MFYRNDDFWNDKGADFISSYLNMLKIKASRDEIFELIAEKEYLDPEIANDFGEVVINYIKAWNFVREIIIKIKAFEKKYARRMDTLILEEFIGIYSCMDPSKKYLYMFEGETQESLQFLSKIERIISKMTIVETFDSLLEYLLAAAYDLTLDNCLGDITFRFFFWLVETALISRGFGPAIFQEGIELEEIWKLHFEILKFAKQNNAKNFSLCPEFRTLVTMFKDKVENFNFNDRKKYE